MGALNQDDARVINQFRLVAAFAAITLAGGAIFYHIVEKLNWLDAVYFCTITLTTIGYGDIVPKTPEGKLFTIFYVLTGVGIIATFANLALKRAVIRRKHASEERSVREFKDNKTN